MENHRLSDEEKSRTEHELDLPFHREKRDVAGWAYDHRVGLFITIVVYLILGILFVTYRISMARDEGFQGFYIDLEEMIREKEELEHQLEQLMREQQPDREYYENVRTAVSNEEGRPDAGLRDDRGTNADQLYNEANELQSRLDAAREAYEQGVREAEEILAQRNQAQQQQGTGETRESVRVQGNVTVSYHLPGRQGVYLHIPAYQCEGGGEVVVSIAVGRNGRVLSAQFASGSSDPCLRDMAIQAALVSTFNVDGTAPARQNGTITYLFIPQ